MKRSYSDDERGVRRIRRRISETPEIADSAVILKIGKTETVKTFVFKKNDLMHHSDLFRLGLATITTITGGHESNLDELDPTLFAIFHLYVTHGQIFSSLDNDYQPSQPDEPFDFVDEEWLRLANAWALGDFLMSCTFKDAITDAIIAKLSEEDKYPVNLHEVIYPKSKRASSIRKLLVDIAVWSFQAGDLQRQGHKEGMSEFYYDVVVALNDLKLQERNKARVFAMEDTCKYHEHAAAGKACYKTMI